MPEAAPLALVRTDIDRRPHRIKRVLMEPGIRKEVLGGISNDEQKAVKAFVAQNGENALKTKPKVGTISSSSGPSSYIFHFTHCLVKMQLVSRPRFVRYVRRQESLEVAPFCTRCDAATVLIQCSLIQDSTVQN